MLVKAVLGKSSAGSMLQYCFNRNILDNVGPMLQKKSMIKESKLPKKTLLNMNVWKSCNEQMGNNQSMHLSAPLSRKHSAVTTRT